MKTIFDYISQGLYNWMYLGLSEKTIKKYSRKVSEDNLRLVKKQCFILIFVMIIGMAALTPLSAPISKYVALIICGPFFFFMYLSIDKAQKRSYPVPYRLTLVYIVVFVAILAALCIYLGTFGGTDNVSAMFIAFLIFSQVNFDFPPITNVTLLFFSETLFLIMSYQSKSLEIFMYDALNSTIAAILGCYMSWNKAKNKWEYLISHDELEQMNSALYLSSTIDGLTGLANRRYIFALFENMLSERAKKPCGFVCMVTDIDWFKSFNDTYGHPKGDEILRCIGAALNDFSLRHNVTAGRIGGEEFMLFWKKRSDVKDEAIAEEFRGMIQQLPHPDAHALTISAGMFICDTQTVVSSDKSYAIADNALYHAKGHGRNCCWKYNTITNIFSSVSSEL